MKENGFTLIELLAVIVILAIIALIATPIVLNIIEDSKDSSKLNSANHYIDAVEQAIMKYNINNGGNFVPRECNIQSNGNLKCDEKDINVEVDGEKPISGKIVIDSGNISNIVLTYGDKTIAKDKQGNLVFLVKPVSFAEDSWETIVANVEAGNLSKYNVGDTKEIALTGFTNEETGSNGLYTIRIANTSTPEECGTEGFSKTACGFVIEFADVITPHAMNSNETNLGGWNASEMRTYVNETIYNAFSKELKENITDTYVVSGHGSTSGEINFTTTDKLYLLSPKEVWGEVSNDTSKEQTRQLDYYKSLGVTTDNYSGAIKKYNRNSVYWWLRSAYPSSAKYFNIVSNSGAPNRHNANYTHCGVAVAFRIG